MLTQTPRVMLSETKHLAQGLSRRHCEILHVVQDDTIAIFLHHGSVAISLPKFKGL